MAEPGLAQLQLWLHEAILAGEAAPGQAEALIGGDARLSANGRLAIYANGYRARLTDALAGEYPAMKSLLGETVFRLFADAYVAARPPGHYSLYALGGGFADWLEATRPPEGDTRLPASLARLERARAEAQRATGIERIADTGFAGADTALTPGVRLRLPDSVRLLRLDFDFIPLIAATDRGEPPVVPEARETFTAVARSRYRIGMHALDPWRFAWLEALGSDGAEIQAAATIAARTTKREVGATLADVALWLPAAAQMGLVMPA